MPVTKELFDDKVEKSFLRVWVMYLKGAEESIKEGNLKHASQSVKYVRQVMEKQLGE